MPSARSQASSDPDTQSLLSQFTINTIGDSLANTLVRVEAKKGFTFNVMSVGMGGMNKTTILSALFNKNLEFKSEHDSDPAKEDPYNPPVRLQTKSFDIEDKGFRFKLTVVESTNYDLQLIKQGTYKPMLDYIDAQFAEYHKRESGYDRRRIPDTMIHCMFFFISPLGHGLSKLDIDFLKAVHNRVNIIPIIARAETLNSLERASFKRRFLDDLERHKISVYQMPDPDVDDPDEDKRTIQECREAMPFAVTSMYQTPDGNFEGKRLDGDRLFDWKNPYHSDFLLLKTMLHRQIKDLRDSTHEIFYEEYRLRAMSEHGSIASSRSRAPSTLSGM